jgi:pilus assembly protein CpaF
MARPVSTDCSRPCRRALRHVILDIPHGWSSWIRHLLAKVDEVVIVAEPDLANLRNAKNMVDTLRQLRPNDAAPRLVLNKRQRAQASRDQGERVHRRARHRSGSRSRRADRYHRPVAAGQARRPVELSAREEIRDVVNDIIALKNVAMSIAEQEELLEDICNDVLGYGPLEPLLARDDIADIMVNGADTVYIEVEGKVQQTNVRFRDNSQLMNICQRIVSQVGRRVDESSPICDARLPDGSRVNVIAPPLAIDGTALTIRKFKKDKLTLDSSSSSARSRRKARRSCRSSAAVRCNVLISGGTGSGKTTLLNCLTAYIDQDERIITCEDSAELQLQQPHVVRLETRPPNLEGEGEITMRDLVKNCLRMRPERIIVGEVRGPEAFDLLQAMNTGHDGSMGTLHANSRARPCRVWNR